MELSDIDPERMQAASEALDKVIKAGGTAAEARAEFERVIKGGMADAINVMIQAEAVGIGGDVERVVEAKPARKPRSDKGSKRKPPTNKPEAETLEVKVGQAVLELFAMLRNTP